MCASHISHLPKSSLKNLIASGNGTVLLSIKRLGCENIPELAETDTRDFHSQIFNTILVIPL
jgi:hypothetical protein